MSESMNLSATYCDTFDNYMTLHPSYVLTTTSRSHSKQYPGIPLLQIESIVHEMPARDGSFLSEQTKDKFVTNTKTFCGAQSLTLSSGRVAKARSLSGKLLREIDELNAEDLLIQQSNTSKSCGSQMLQPPGFPHNRSPLQRCDGSTAPTLFRL